MKTKTINIYSFNELSESAKDKATEKLYDINVSHDWWDSVYEDFRSICKTIGVDVDMKNTFFSGFSSQGDGSCFDADVDLFELIKGIEEKKYLEYAPNIEKDNQLSLSACNVDKRVLKLISEGVIDFCCSFEGKERSYRVDSDCAYNYTYNQCVNYRNIDSEGEKLEEWLQDVASELNSLLYNLLEKEYDYMTSKEAVIETIEANQYEFDQYGNII